MITELKTVKRSNDDVLMRLAESIRAIADRVESGETIAVAWVEMHTKDSYRHDVVKAKGVGYLELIGAIECLKATLISIMNEDEI